jgi:hypothetical protein
MKHTQGLIIFTLTLLLSGCSPQTSQKIVQVPENPQPTTITEEGIPNRHLIETAFVPQAPEKKWDQPWQDACEEASILTVSYHYLNQSPDINQMVADYQSIFSFETNNGWGHDINNTQMATVSSQMFNLKPLLISNPDINTIKKYLSQNVPVIVTANGKSLYKENKHFKSGGPWYHSLVILGYDDQKNQFTVHDVGTQFGAYYHYSYQLLMNSIHDLPSNNRKEDIDQGEKRILVLLK